eukprot:gene3048-3240_t
MSWRELLDQKRVLFQTPPDRAVFWSGWNGGRDPEVCNSAKARRYAEEYSKFTLETTEGGKRLTETYGWFDPSSLFSENEANAVWRYASEHYLKQAEGHVVGFALDRTHPLYSGLSIYQTVERPVLKDRMSTFLSENLTFPEKRSEGSLTPEQIKLLENPEAKAVLQEIQQWFQTIRVEWMKIGTVDCFTHENLTIFLHNHDVNIGGKITATDRLLSDLDKVERLGSVLEEYVLQAKAMIQSWEPIYLSVRALDCYYIKSEKKSIDEARVQALRARSSLRRCKDLHGWKENQEWLQHVLHSICYHIYRAFKQLGDFDSARNWQKESLQREISIDEVPTLFIEAFSDQESSNGIVNTAIPSKLKNMAHLMAKNTIDNQQPVKLDPLQIRKEEEELFNYLPSLTRSNEDMEIQRSQLWQQRMIDLFKLHEESDNNWKKEKTIYETTFQKLFEEFRENQKALKALEDESQELVSQLDTLYSEGEEARRAIEQNPRIARLLTVSLDENTKQFALLNEKVSSFQAQYPSKKLELSEAARRSSNALLKLVMEYSSAEIEAKDRERVSVHRLTSIHEIAMMHEITTKGFQSSSVEETKEVLEIQALYKGTMSNWDRMSEEIDQLLENSSKTKLTGNKSLITKIEALSVEIESISGKDYHSRIAMKAALAIAATARSLRQLKEMIHKMLLGRKDRKHYVHHHEIIEKAKDLQIQAQRRLEKEDLESIRTELNLCADQTIQIFNWSERLMNLSLLNQIEDSLSTRSEDENETVASPEKSEMLMMLEEQLHLLQQSDSDDSNVSISTLLEVKAIILEKQKKLLEAEKELALRREELETRERLLETEKERLKDNHNLSAHIPPLLENILVNEISVELQIENTFHVEEGILHEGEELSVSRQVMEEKSQTTAQPENKELVTQTQQIEQQEQQLQVDSAKTKKEIYAVRLERRKEKFLKLLEAEEELELDEGLKERRKTNLKREKDLLLKQKKVVEAFEGFAAEKEVEERSVKSEATPLTHAAFKETSSQNEEFQVQPQLKNANDRGGGSQSIYTSNYWKNDSKAVILDCGSYTCKIGFSGDKGPRVVIPTVVGRAKFATRANTFIGNDVIPKVHTLSRPIQNGTITNWDDMENLWYHFFSFELSIDPSKHPILLTEPIQNQKFTREKTTQIMFERFHVPALYLESQPVLSLYGSGKTTGLVVHSGHSQTVAQPMSDGQRCGKPLFTRVNGATVDAFLCRALRVEGKLTIDQPIKVVSDIKETCGYVALDYRQELKKDSNQVQTPYQLPDGKMITIGSERFQCSEVLFNPTMWIDCDSFREGLNNGIHELISQTIINCDPTLQRDLSSSIILSGGNTMFPGIVERLTKEVINLNNVQVVASHKRDLLPWIGGSILSSLSSIQGMWITKAEYDETGPSIVHRKG